MTQSGRAVPVTVKNRRCVKPIPVRTLDLLDLLSAENVRFFPLATVLNLLEQCGLKMEYLWIALGSALGGVTRYWLSGVVARRLGESFPVGTLMVNVTGSFVIGFIATLSDPGGRLLMSVTARQFVMLGLLGGYTTFSSFSLQTLNLARDGEWLYASANVVLSVILCLLAVWVGQVIARMINR